MSSSNSSHVVNPNSNTWLGNYYEAAQVAALFMYNPNFQTAGLAVSNIEMLNRQYAIWEAMGFDVTARANYSATRVGEILDAAAGWDISSNQWLVLTNADKNRQEFIYFDPSRPYETVPEPATMTLLATGLAGMAAARRRRNNKS